MRTAMNKTHFGRNAKNPCVGTLHYMRRRLGTALNYAFAFFCRCINPSDYTRNTMRSSDTIMAWALSLYFQYISLHVSRQSVRETGGGGERHVSDNVR
jgi:hypothetical protein